MANFSLPAVVTCPGRTRLCTALCYARRYRYKLPEIQRLYRRNYRAARSPRFVERMVEDIRRLGAKVVRVHPSGDFFSAAYVRKWIRIARACPDVTFYAYTRSWRRKVMLPALRDLAALPNFHLWLSADTEAHQVPDIPGARVAYLAVSYEDRPPAGTDLVFLERTLRPRRPERRLGGVLICPEEQHLSDRARVTCAKCRLCFGRPIPAAPLPKAAAGH